MTALARVPQVDSGVIRFVISSCVGMSIKVLDAGCSLPGSVLWGNGFGEHECPL